MQSRDKMTVTGQENAATSSFNQKSTHLPAIPILYSLLQSYVNNQVSKHANVMTYSPNLLHRSRTPLLCLSDARAIFSNIDLAGKRGVARVGT